MSFQAGMPVPNLPWAAPCEPGVPVECSWCGSKGKYDQLLNGRDLRCYAKASHFDFARHAVKFIGGLFLGNCFASSRKSEVEEWKINDVLY